MVNRKKKIATILVLAALTFSVFYVLREGGRGEGAGAGASAGARLTKPVLSAENVPVFKQPSLSRQGILYYVSNENNGPTAFDLWQMDLTTRQKERLSNVGDCSFPVVAPEGDKIAINRGKDIFLFDLNQRQWTKLGVGLKPQWRSDGIYIADTGLIIRNVVNKRQWTVKPALAVKDKIMSVSWYPDGKNLLVSYRHEGLFLYRLEDWDNNKTGTIVAQGKRLLPEMYIGGSYGAACVQPQLRAVSFIAGTGGYRWIYTTYPQGGEPYLYDSKENKAMPEDEGKVESDYTLNWAPDGERLCFSRYKPSTGKQAIYVLEYSGRTTEILPGNNL